jgi:hypothetical protein
VIVPPPLTKPVGGTRLKVFHREPHKEGPPMNGYPDLTGMSLEQLCVLHTRLCKAGNAAHKVWSEYLKATGYSISEYGDICDSISRLRNHVFMEYLRHPNHPDNKTIS